MTWRKIIIFMGLVGLSLIIDGFISPWKTIIAGFVPTTFILGGIIIGLSIGLWLIERIAKHDINKEDK